MGTGENKAAYVTSANHRDDLSEYGLPQRSGWFKDLPIREKKNDGISSLMTQCCSATEVLGRVKTESLPQLITTCAVQGCLSVL